MKKTRVLCTDAQMLTASMIAALDSVALEYFSETHTLRKAYDFDMPNFPFAEEKIPAITYGPPKIGKRGKVKKW